MSSYSDTICIVPRLPQCPHCLSALNLGSACVHLDTTTRFGNRIGTSRFLSGDNQRKGKAMTSENPTPRSLRDMELEVLAEGREWMRQRLEQKLQAEADRHGGV